jgi:hypothetical protein
MITAKMYVVPIRCNVLQLIWGFPCSFFHHSMLSFSYCWNVWEKSKKSVG